MIADEAAKLEHKCAKGSVKPPAKHQSFKLDGLEIARVHARYAGMGPSLYSLVYGNESQE